MGSESTSKEWRCSDPATAEGESIDLFSASGHGNTDGEGQAALLLILRSAYSACTSKTPVETLGTVEHSIHGDFLCRMD